MFANDTYDNYKSEYFFHLCIYIKLQIKRFMYSLQYLV